MKIDVVRLIADLVFEAISMHSTDHGKREKRIFMQLWKGWVVLSPRQGFENRESLK